MKGFFSLFSRSGRLRKKTNGGRGPAARSAADGPPGQLRPPVMKDQVRDDGSAEKPEVPDPPLNGGASAGKEKGAFLRMVTGPDRDLFLDPFRYPDSGRGGSADEAGQGELYSAPAFRAEMRDEDIPFHRGGFADQTAGEWQESFRESFRILFDRAEETKEILSQLTETADEIRKELTI